MPGKIFINYRRADDRSMAARVRDRLAQTFGNANVFMDVDNLMAGQRFDKELEKALAETDVFLAIIGPRWMELLAERRGAGERDYVHDEIVGALKKGATVIPLLIEGTPMPRADALPDDISEIVLHQKHAVTHEQFGRDVAGLVEAIRFARKPAPGPPRPQVPWGWVGATAASVVAIGYVSAHQLGVPVPWPWAPTPQSVALAPSQDQLAKAARESVRKDKGAQKAAADVETRRTAAEQRQRRAEEAEQAAYVEVAKVNTIAAWEAFLQAYPNGRTAPSARHQLANLQKLEADAKAAAKADRDRRAGEQPRKSDVLPPPAGAEVPKTEAAAPAAADSDAQASILTIQQGLSRAGCLRATPNGVWGPLTQLAAIRFNEISRQRIVIDKPTPDAIAVLDKIQQRLCPLDCQFEKVEQDGQCVAARRPSLEPGRTFQDCPNCPVMVVIPAGSVNVRSSSGAPMTLPRPIAVSKFEVTHAEWDACTAAQVCAYSTDYPDKPRNNRPVTGMYWNDAAKYADWLARTTGQPYRLLTEVEWEYAARAGTTTRYWWGDDVGKGNANCRLCGSPWDNKSTAPVGSFKPNAFGLYDMLGNAEEWVQGAVVRGGHWNSHPDSITADTRRQSSEVGDQDNGLGLRVARSLP